MRILALSTIVLALAGVAGAAPGATLLAASGPLAAHPADRVERRSGRRSLPAASRAVRLPLPVPRRRREHRAGLVDLESGRLLRIDVRAGLVVARRRAGADLLHAPAVEARRRGRGARRSRQPGQPADDGGLLGRRAPALPTRARDEARRRPRRARSVGLPGAGERDHTRRVVRPAVGHPARPARAERDPRLPHERVGDEARHRLRESARRDRARLRRAVRGVLPVAAREVRRVVRGLLGPRRRLLREDQQQPEHLVHPGRLPPAHALRADVRPPRGTADGRLADPARQHVDARDGQPVGPLPGQPGAAAPRAAVPGAPARCTSRPASSASCSGAAQTAPRARATRRRTASRTRRRSTGTRARR